jgi:putative toxin-antitoxin system antitoxin component (TIGR02293 family)
VLTKATEVLGGKEEAEQWLAAPAIGLDSRRPIDLMATPQGAEMVKTLLDQMAYGVYA